MPTVIPFTAKNHQRRPGILGLFDSAFSSSKQAQRIYELARAGHPTWLIVQLTRYSMNEVLGIIERRGS